MSRHEGGGVVWADDPNRKCTKIMIYVHLFASNGWFVHSFESMNEK
jgi:hypothetical protein